jgi:hypothetical protein
LTLDSTLKLTVANVGTGGQTTFNNLPAVKFLADGTIDETSPQTLTLVDADGFGRLFLKNKTRTGYDVDSSSAK